MITSPSKSRRLHDLTQQQPYPHPTSMTPKTNPTHTLPNPSYPTNRIARPFLCMSNYNFMHELVPYKYVYKPRNSIYSLYLN